jgi:hypothetical protein
VREKSKSVYIHVEEESVGEYHKVQIGDQLISPIDWEMDPSLSFGTFESWGGRERVRNNDECVYYFFVDNWGDEPILCLMERAVKHAKVMADIKAPPDMLKACVKGQGSSATFEKSYAINDQVKQWLIDNVLDGGDANLIVPRVEVVQLEDMGPALPAADDNAIHVDQLDLPSEARIINDDQIEDLIKKWNFFDSDLNPEGRFDNHLVSGGQPELIVDKRTNLMWQRDGIDIGSIRHMQKSIKEINEQNFGGYSDWRMPTMEEALSLMEPVKNSKDIYLKLCFSKEQPFVFVNAQRKPGGYWYVDYKQGRAFWSSGTIPGGFGRLVRSVKSS